MNVAATRCRDSRTSPSLENDERLLWVDIDEPVLSWRPGQTLDLNFGPFNQAFSPT